MNSKSGNLQYQDALWRNYINSDPDLRRMEAHKRRTAYRHLAAKAHARRVRNQIRRAARWAAVETLAAAGAVVVIVWALMLLLFGLC